MQDDCIAVAMGLPELLILGQIELEDHFEVTVRYRRDKVPCPRCGSVMVKKHESEFQRKKDRKLRDKTDEGKPKASRVIGLDEFSVKKRIFDTTISDLKARQLLGIVEGCGKTNLEKYFTALPEPEIVEVVVMDMHEPFRQAVHLCLPRASIVVDVIVHVNQALDKVRTRLQSKEIKGRRRLLFHNRYLLLRKAESLSPEEQVRLSRLFSLYPELAAAWRLKESLSLTIV